MSELEIAEAAVSKLTRPERATLLARLAEDLAASFPGVDSTPNVCGGEARIVRTRIPVWLLVRARELGTSEADLLLAYPTLRAEDLAQAWHYARAHQDEIRHHVAANEE